MSKIIVKTLWISDILDNHQKLCMQSFLKNDSIPHIYSYGKIKNLPEGAVLKDANEIIPEEYVFKDLYNSYATFSDWFRIKLLFLKGGWWVDSDMLCIKPFNITSPYVFATEKIERGGDHVINISNCVIKMPKNSEIGKTILHNIENTLTGLVDKTKIQWTAIGAKTLGEEILKKELTNYIVSPLVFCPIDFHNYKDIFQDPSFELSDITYGIHLWNKMWEWSQTNPLENGNTDSKLFNLIQNIPN